MKVFNDYYPRLNAHEIRDFIKTHGKMYRYGRNEYFSRENEIPKSFGWLETGAFRYTLTTEDGKTYNTGFSFAGEPVVDYFNFLYGFRSKVDIQAITDSEIIVISHADFISFQDSSADNLRFVKQASEYVGLELYDRMLSLYADTPEMRYAQLLKRCPHVLDILTLKNIASYLRVTPETVSHIRKKLL